jgi:hypothetical protein
VIWVFEGDRKMEFLTEKKAAIFIGMSYHWLKMLRKARKIRYYRIGKSAIRYRKDDLIFFLNGSVVETLT